MARTKEHFDKISEFFETMPKVKKEVKFKCPKCEKAIIIIKFNYPLSHGLNWATLAGAQLQKVATTDLIGGVRLDCF